jgi:hypothetical protein
VLTFPARKAADMADGACHQELSNASREVMLGALSVPFAPIRHDPRPAARCQDAGKYREPQGETAFPRRRRPKVTQTGGRDDCCRPGNRHVIGHGAALKIARWWHCQQDTPSDHTPFARMLPSVTGSFDWESTHGRNPPRRRPSRSNANVLGSWCHRHAGYRLWPLGFLGKTPTILPVASIRRKVSGSCPGWRRDTSCARSLAAAIASAALVKTEVSLSTRMPFLSQSIANNSIS